ncbi:dihydrofolate reductase [Iamia sp. SCSIO 61187]|uniref:dihydrofolate reductase family protein n=1 Tax=Iamia sp. SCSIO 61187 TaxID=2722752 RepID=UPI001C63A709|nr:dihydrofolate reductase family protein [Iamia sp. SCSIO 61187]QYG91146.1 dihydrofolate reductase [Iamia sp. SCSIO 61187]
MGKVIYDMSVSLDGFVTAAGISADEPLGVGGAVLHDWAMGSDPADAEALAAGSAGLGAIIAGRRTYDSSIRWWGPDGPTGPRRLPLFVVTHAVPDDGPDGSVYTFVTEGLDAALDRARDAAGEGDVAIMGGPDLGQQYLDRGLVDEVGLHVVPVLFGAGQRMFGDLAQHLRLESVDVTPAPSATHLRYRIVR